MEAFPCSLCLEGSVPLLLPLPFGPFRQVQIFFALLSSMALKYSADVLAAATNMDAMLCMLTVLPMASAFYIEALHEHVSEVSASLESLRGAASSAEGAEGGSSESI